MWNLASVCQAYFNCFNVFFPIFKGRNVSCDNQISHSLCIFLYARKVSPPSLTLFPEALSRPIIHYAAQDLWHKLPPLFVQVTDGSSGLQDQSFHSLQQRFVSQGELVTTRPFGDGERSLEVCT